MIVCNCLCSFHRHASNKLVYARAGHPPAILWKSSSQELVQLANGNTILGPFPNVDYENTVVDVSVNDRLVLYTDGIIETGVKSGELFGIDRFESLLRESVTQSHERTAGLIVDRVEKWARNSGKTSLDDDLTLVIIDLVSGED
ncbi:MAG: SpoIIE family protein phosphatase [Candidatus Marinimicrobia bacterium]|nr:SpoIIE family protein phosphatase [Candidatus Neomarinimicrobiota bacterium]